MPTELAEGAKAPAFNLPRDGGGSLSLADFNGRKLVLYFYPKADTPGCTREAIEFSKLRAEYQKAGADVVLSATTWDLASSPPMPPKLSRSMR